MIQDPKRIDSGGFTNLTLLPVHPPEINTFIFKRVVDCFEISVQKFPVGGVECDWLFVNLGSKRRRVRDLPLYLLDLGLKPYTSSRMNLRML